MIPGDRVMMYSGNNRHIWRGTIVPPHVDKQTPKDYYRIEWDDGMISYVAKVRVEPDDRNDNLL